MKFYEWNSLHNIPIYGFTIALYYLLFIIIITYIFTYNYILPNYRENNRIFACIYV